MGPLPGEGVDLTHLSSPAPSTGASTMACLFPSLMSPHQERREAMEDVGQCEQDSGLALHLPLGALLLHQPPFLCPGKERRL